MRNWPVFLIALTALSCSTAPLQPAGPVVVVEREISVDIEQPTDIRWADPSHVLVSARNKGVARVSIDGQSGSEWLPSWPPPKGIGTRYVYLGRSATHQATADLAFGLRWVESSDEARIEDTSIEYVADIDVADDRLLVMGLRRDLAGELGGDGATAWIGRLGDEGLVLRPVLPFKSRATIEACAGFDLSAVRFLSGGGFVLVPGAEPGVYVYDADARLVRTWDSGALGIDADCVFDRDEQAILATDPDARQQWLNSRRIVDDVVAIDHTPALIVRSYTAGLTRWSIHVLDPAGDRSHDLPITSSSPHCHATADYRDGRLALLLSDSHGKVASPRLVILSWPQS